MKCEVKRKIILNITLDSSEAVMFTKGGSHKVVMPFDDVFCEYDSGSQIEMNVQLEKSEQFRFNHVTGVKNEN